jgi:hypothetical protein
MKKLLAVKGTNDRFMRCAHLEVEKISDDCYSCMYCKKLLSQKEIDEIGSEVFIRLSEASLSASDLR